MTSPPPPDAESYEAGWKAGHRAGVQAGPAPRIAADPDGVPVQLIDLTGDELHLTAWGVARYSRGAVLVLTEDGEPPNRALLRGLACELAPEIESALIAAETRVAGLRVALDAARTVIANASTPPAPPPRPRFRNPLRSTR